MIPVYVLFFKLVKHFPGLSPETLSFMQDSVFPDLDSHLQQLLVHDRPKSCQRNKQLISWHVQIALNHYM